MAAQRQAIDLFKWQQGERIGRDPGDAAVSEWIEKYSCKFRKEFILTDLKTALQELGLIRKYTQEYLDKIMSLNKVIDDCEKKILNSLELFE